MIVLDENILDGQRLLLEASGVAVRQIGFDVGHKGLKDDAIIVLLRAQRNVTFFTRDAGFYSQALCHKSYCLVVMSVAQNEVATFVRRFLGHPDFDTQARRAGKVVRVSHSGLAVWRLRSQIAIHTVWSPDVRARRASKSRKRGPQ